VCLQILFMSVCSCTFYPSVPPSVSAHTVSSHIATLCAQCVCILGSFNLIFLSPVDSWHLNPSMTERLMSSYTHLPC
jgi:hypothetical protein